MHKLGITIIGLCLPYFCACPKPGPGFPRSYVMFFMCSVSECEVIGRFVNIGEIVDHHVLNMVSYNVNVL